MSSLSKALRFVVDCTLESFVDTAELVVAAATFGYEVFKSEGIVVENENSDTDIESHFNEVEDVIYDYSIFSYDETIYPNKVWELSGETTVIKSREGDDYFIFIKEGKHQMSDANFSIQYSVESYCDSLGQKKMYFDHINVNNIPVDGKVTNKRRAVSVLNDIANITKGAAFNEDAIGERFFVDCAAILLFNKINCNRSLGDYMEMPKDTLKSFLINARKNLDIYIGEVDDMYSDESSNNTSTTGQQSFEIYLKVLEFDSIYYVKYDDIKAQYKKLAKKYHPDSVSGDATRFKLVTDTYEYLKENYPK